MFRWRAVYRLTDRLYGAPSLSEIYEASLDAMIELLDCGKASILRFDQGGVMRFVAWRDLSDTYRKAVDGHSPWRQGQRDPEPIFIGDVAKSDETSSLLPVLRQEGIQALAFIPVTLNRATVGKFMLYYDAPHVFDEEEREIALILARQLSLSIERHGADLAASRLMALVESSDDAIVAKNLDGIIQSWNRGAENLFGYKAEETVGKSITILIPEDRLVEEASILSRIRKGERVDHYETVRRRKDGGLVHVSLTISPIVDANGNILGASKIARDITERHHARERQQLLLREMNHRVKNLFAVTSSIINLNARSAASVADLATSVTNRLNALSRAHSLTMVVNEAAESSVESGVTLHGLAEAILFPYDQGARSRLSIVGDDLAIAAKSITPLALLLHEFATNAAKYGSLSNEDGRVDITCRLDDQTAEIVWRETHGPQHLDDGEKGFGSRLVEASAIQLGGRVDRQWEAGGLVIRIELSRQLLESPDT
ncbi:PAS domain S-box protein [Nordella sp. HKS 07]|uniref:sensor histidine kinase n=1 Tax=Nordella sp. HKS 07 TaxID=2712222 RepID=UPI0013E10599|nr:PAS domain S-box protein [Nordella sp. HKS 07]QIG46986.1 PAS domain S-box protein [Nordella sp. HKS 07]